MKDKELTIVDLKYGRGNIKFTLPEDIPRAILRSKAQEALPNPKKVILQALRSPIASAPLREKFCPGESVCIIVNDATRVARSEIFLPLLIEEILTAGVREEDIFIIFASGTHRPLNREEMVALVGEEIASRFSLYNHDCRDEEELVFLGCTSFGTPVQINRKAFEADHRILTGSVVHHFFAGFGGGRKALVPGVAGWETIRRNHSLLLDERASTGRLTGNPVHEDLLEAALLAGGDFLLNTVLNEEHEIVQVFAGDMVEAHLAACALVEDINGVKINSLADVVIASCGGYPKDINMYQAHKSLDNAIAALKPGGTVIFLAQCLEGVGSELYEEWVEKGSSLLEMKEILQRNFLLGGHKAYTVARLLQKGTVYLLSDFKPEKSGRLGFISVRNMEEAIAKIYRERRDLFTYIIPQASTTIPRPVG